MKTLPNDQFLAIVRKRAKTLAVKRRHRIVCCDDLRAYCMDKGITPKSNNAWGSVFRSDVWQQVGFRQSVTPTRRGGIQRSWYYAGGAG